MQFGPFSPFPRKNKNANFHHSSSTNELPFSAHKFFLHLQNNFVMPAYGSAPFGIFIPREFSAVAAAEALRFDAASDKVSKFSTIVKSPTVRHQRLRIEAQKLILEQRCCRTWTGSRMVKAPGLLTLAPHLAPQGAGIGSSGRR